MFTVEEVLAYLVFLLIGSASLLMFVCVLAIGWAVFLKSKGKLPERRGVMGVEEEGRIMLGEEGVEDEEAPPAYVEQEEEANTRGVEGEERRTKI